MIVSYVLRQGDDFSEYRGQAHLTVLRVFCAIHDALDTEGGAYPFLKSAENRYERYLDLLVSLKDTPASQWPLPPWDVALVYHSHMLAPRHFWNDITKSNRYAALLATDIAFPLERLYERLRAPGQLADDEKSALAWKGMYPDLPYNIIDIAVRPTSEVAFAASLSPDHYLSAVPPSYEESPSIEPRFGLDLASAAIRQRGFAQKITKLYLHDPVISSRLAEARTRYVEFMEVMRTNKIMLVPTLDIDLFWHTHQLRPKEYQAWCETNVGRNINHDDNLEDGDLKQGLVDTEEAWFRAFKKPYLTGNTQAFPEQPSTDPPPTLTNEQRQLWVFDVERQREHEEMETKLQRQEAEVEAISHRVAELEVEAKRIGDMPFASDIKISSEEKEQMGFFSKLKTERKEKKAVKEKRNSALSPVKAQLTYTKRDLLARQMQLATARKGAQKERGKWQIERLELLKNANGGRLPRRSTKGKSPEELRREDYHYYFPLYAATWYTPYYATGYGYGWGGGACGGGFTCGASGSGACGGGGGCGGGS